MAGVKSMGATATAVQPFISSLHMPRRKLGKARLHYAGTMGWQMEYVIPHAIAIVKGKLKKMQKSGKARLHYAGTMAGDGPQLPP